MGKIKLDEREVAQLEIVLKTTDDVRQLQRAQALLWLSEGDRVSEVAERLRVDRRTVYNWASRFEQRIDNSADAASRYLLEMSPKERLRKAGILSDDFWLLT
jgi:Homeodomain-like domain